VSETWLALFSKVKMNSGLECDPYELNSFIGEIVSVSSSTGVRHIGRLIALDPVSSSVVLICSKSTEAEESNEIRSSSPAEKSVKSSPEDNIKSPFSDFSSETLKKEIVVLPWIDLSKLSVVESKDLQNTAEQDQLIREKLLCSEKKTEVEKVSSNYNCDPEIIVDWLKKHQLCVEFQQEIISIQGGLVKLKPPYTVNDCQATNLIVLDRVTSILAQMPPAV